MGAIGLERVPCSSHGAGYCVVSMTTANRKRVRTADACALRCRVALALDKVDQMPDSIVETGGGWRLPLVGTLSARGLDAS